MLNSQLKKDLLLLLLSMVAIAVEEESELKLLAPVLHKVNHKQKEIQHLQLFSLVVSVTIPMKKEWVKYSKIAVKLKILECH